jgi:hypothetical protein
VTFAGRISSMDFFGQGDTIPIQGRNVVLLSSLKGRSDDELRQVLTSLGGKLSFFQVIRGVDTVMACFETEDEAAKAVLELKGEEIHFGDVRDRKNSFPRRFYYQISTFHSVYSHRFLNWRRRMKSKTTTSQICCFLPV